MKHFLFLFPLINFSSKEEEINVNSSHVGKQRAMCGCFCVFSGNVLNSQLLLLRQSEWSADSLNAVIFFRLCQNGSAAAYLQIRFCK